VTAPVQSAPAAPQPAPELPGTQAGGVGDEANDFNLLKILAAHESRRAPAPDSVARKLAEASKSTAADDSGDGEPIQTSRRRNRAAFDYVQTDALRADMTPNEIQNMQRTAAKPAAPAPVPTPAEDVSEATFTEIDDAGDIQRSADDSAGTTDETNADVSAGDSSVEDASSPTDMLFAPPSDTDAPDISPTLSPGVQREIDPNLQRMLDEATTVTPSSGESAAGPTQPTIQRQAVPRTTDAPRAVPSQYEAPATPDTPRPVSQPNVPIQREADTLRDIGESVTFTPAPQETRIVTPGTPDISRAADSSARPAAENDIANGTAVPFAAPIQRETTSDVQRLLDQAMTVTPASSAASAQVNTPTSPAVSDTPIQRTSQTTAPVRPSETAANTPIQQAATQNTANTLDMPIQRTASTEPTAQPSVQRTSTTPSAPMQPDAASDVQRLLDQAMTVTPASSATSPQVNTPTSPAVSDTPIQRTPNTTTSASSSITTGTQADTPAATGNTSIQRDYDPEVQRLLDQALSVTPSSAVMTPTDTADSPITPSTASRETPIQRTTSSSAAPTVPDSPSRPSVQRTPQTSTPVSADSIAFTPASSEVPIQRELNTDVQRLLDQALSVTPSASPVEAPAAPTSAEAQSVQRTPDKTSTGRKSSVQRTTETPTPDIRSAGTQALQSQSQPETSFSAPTASTSVPGEAIQREINADVQRLLDQALTVTPSTSTSTPNTQSEATPSSPASTNPPNTPIQRTADKTQMPVSGPIDSVSFTPAAPSQPSVQRALDSSVQNLLDQALSVTPSASAEAPAVTAPTGRPSTPSVQRTPDTPRTASTPSVQRTPETVNNRANAAIQRTPDDAALVPSSGEAVQRALDPEVQHLLDQALSVSPSASAEAPASTTQSQGRSETSSATSTPSVQRTTRDTMNQRTTGPSIQRTPDATPASNSAPVQRALDPEVQRMLDQAMGVSASSSTSTPETSQPASSTMPPARPNLQRRAAPQQPTGNSGTAASPASPSIDPFNRTLDPDIQRRLDEAMRVTPSSSSVARKTSLPVESRRPFIPTPPAASDTSESRPTAGIPNTSPVQRTAATPPSAPAQASTPDASTPSAPTNPQSSGSLESDLLHWMGLPADTPVEGRLSRKPSDSVTDMMRKAELSTARSSENTASGQSSSESESSDSNPSSQSSQEMPSISSMGYRDLDAVQRAVVIDEMSSEVDSALAAGGGEASINDIAKRVMDILRTKLRLERERNRKF